MKNRLLLLLVAFIWGTTFIFQRVSTGTMETFSFIALRFVLGTLAVFPLVIWYRRKERKKIFSSNPKPEEKRKFIIEKNHSAPDALHHSVKPWPLWLCGLIIGTMLFGGSALQQQALVYTTAGKAAFITALYIIAVPLFGLWVRQPLRITHILGGILALIGVYLLAFRSDAQPLNFGDFLTMLGVLFWTLQILFIDHFVRWYPGIYLAEGQFITAALLSFCGIFLAGETITLQSVEQTALPLFYAGIMSSGVAYTLQIIGQANVPPTEASMLMSCEMIFGALAGFLFLNEVMTTRELVGCLIMTGGIFLSQLPGRIIWMGRK